VAERQAAVSRVESRAAAVLYCMVPDRGPNRLKALSRVMGLGLAVVDMSTRTQRGTKKPAGGSLRPVSMGGYVRLPNVPVGSGNASTLRPISREGYACINCIGHCLKFQPRGVEFRHHVRRLAMA
jgi:hypothetical protein